MYNVVLNLESSFYSVSFLTYALTIVMHTHTHTTPGNKIVFAYSVIWQPSDVAWASRWDIYLQMSDVQIHWFAICNSVAIVLFLSGNIILHAWTCVYSGTSE